MNKLKSYALLSAVMIFLSCEKYIVEITPVLQVEKDMSIEGVGDIKFFSFPSDNVGYAASDKNFIYKTVDAGDTWNIIEFATNESCGGLEFFNETEGICLMSNRVYVTSDGGANWNYVRNADRIGKTDDNLGVIVSEWLGTADVYTSRNQGNTFQFLTDYNLPIGDFTGIRVTGSKLMMFTSQLHLDYDLPAISLITGDEIPVRFRDLLPHENPNDIFMPNDRGVMIAQNIIASNYQSQLLEGEKAGSWNYLSVDGNDDHVVCVGERTITSNKYFGETEGWSEIFDFNGNGFNHTFFKIRFIDNQFFYLSGSDGLFLKARL